MSATALERSDVGRALHFRRPAELVEISERVYQRIFAVGLWLATSCALFATILSLLEPAGSQERGVVGCAACLVAVIVAAAMPQPLYRTIRRRPWTLLAPAAMLGLLAVMVGPHSLQIFLPMVSIIGAIGVAVPCRVVVTAALIGAAGLAAPQFIHGAGEFGAALAVIVPPLMLWLIVERIAGFALRFHQSLLAESAPLPTTASDEDGVSSTQTNDVAEQRALPQPPVIEVGGTRLTSRQLQVVLLACEGLRHAEIGACLGIGAQQVRRHLDSARHRTGSASTPQLIAWARQAGLVPLGGREVT